MKEFEFFGKLIRTKRFILTCPNSSIANIKAGGGKIFAIVYVGVFERLQNLIPLISFDFL